MKDNPPTSYEVKEAIKCMQNDKDPGTDQLQAERSRYRWIEFTKMTEILTKDGHQDGRKGLSVPCVEKERNGLYKFYG